MDNKNREKALNEIKRLSPALYEMTTADGDRNIYQMLGRLQMDCEYYLGFGDRNPKYLWAHDEKKQIRLMELLYEATPEKPE